MSGVPVPRELPVGQARRVPGGPPATPVRRVLPEGSAEEGRPAASRLTPGLEIRGPWDRVLVTSLWDPWRPPQGPLGYRPQRD